MAGTIRPLDLVRLPGSHTDFMRVPSYVENVKLAANTSQQITVPTGANFAVFSANVNFYAAYGSNPTAVVPSGSTSDGTGNELNPTRRYVQGQAKIALISASDGIATIAFWN